MMDWGVYEIDIVLYVMNVIVFKFVIVFGGKLVYLDDVFEMLDIL